MHKTLIVVLGLVLAPGAFAVDTPSTLLITGNVLVGAGVTPAVSDTVVVWNPASNEVVAKGNVLSGRGLFSITVNQTSAFDGTPVTLQFQDKNTGRRHQLYEGGAPQDGGTVAEFTYQGGLVPRRATTTVTIGEVVGLAVGEPAPTTPGDGADGGTNGGGTPANPEPDTGSGFDVNDDGVVDQADVQAIKDVVAGRAVRDAIAGRADVNGDGIVNTRDIIAVIKAANAAERERLSANADAAIRRP
jgi:hypothetical protein